MTTAVLDDVDQDQGEGFSDPDAVFHVEPEQDPTVSEDAPYGVNPKTGRPYRFSAEERQRRAQALNAARWAGHRPKTVPKAPPRTSGGTSKNKRAVDYRAGILGLLQLPALVLGLVARTTGNPALALDSATITLHAPDLAEAIDATAQAQPWLAAILDKAVEVGPYGALVTAVLPLALQLAANHGRVPANEQFGILTPEQLIEAVTKAPR